MAKVSASSIYNLSEELTLQAMDPQIRMLYETTFEAFESGTTNYCPLSIMAFIDTP
jgi:hypothetical protein